MIHPLTLEKYRILYRLVQFTAPEGSPRSKYIDDHEWLVYVFDATPMFLAILIMNFCHPGKVIRMFGKEYNVVPLQRF